VSSTTSGRRAKSRRDGTRASARRPSSPLISPTLDPDRERDELRAYLGDAYDQGLLERYQQTLDDEWAACGDEQAFYRSSNAYLYNLTAFAMTGTKLPYLHELVRHVPPGARVLDYGCGIGSDGLMLLEAGYRVEFADFDNPSAEFLRWRLAQRGFDAPVHDVDKHVPDGYDAAFAFDVIEHASDPFAFLAEMEKRARLVEVNLLGPVPFDHELHHELPIRALLSHVARRRLVSYQLLHGRSHLVVYRPEQSTVIGRGLGLARLAVGRVRAGR
jgi:SAM-dependent methyltransferase